MLWKKAATSDEYACIPNVRIGLELVRPTLSQDDIAIIASGRHQMDAFVRRYIHENSATAL
jgi:hypothetical protein